MRTIRIYAWATWMGLSLALFDVSPLHVLIIIIPAVFLEAWSRTAK